MRTHCVVVAAVLMVAALIASWPVPALGYVVGQTTLNWTMWEGSQTVSYNLYDYWGKITLVNCFQNT